MLVPGLILQPFAENAIWHGLLNKEGSRHLHISLFIEDEMLHCIITDNGIGRANAALIKNMHKQHISRGMQLITKRLEILKQQTNAQASLQITDLCTETGTAAGTKVEIILPLLMQ